MGTIGNIAVVPENSEIVTANRAISIIRLKENSGFDPYFVAAYLDSNIGVALRERESQGGIQQRINLEALKRIKIPIFSEKDQLKIRANITYGLKKHQESIALFAEAEGLLLQEFGLDSLDLSPKIAHTTNYSEAMEARRLDAEYWGHQYAVLIDYLREIPHDKLVQLASFSNGATPRGAEYLDSGVPFLRIQNVGKNKLNLDNVVYIDEMTHDKLLRRSQLKPGDVLITITGRIGTSAVVPKNMPKGNINQHIVRLRLKRSGTNPYYISTFLNSTFGRLQTEREAYGTTREALPYYCLERVIVPKASEDLKIKVEQKILEAERSLSDAKILLEKAKYNVEKMILSRGLEE